MVKITVPEEEEESSDSELQSPLFENDGNPINFFIHTNITRGRKKLERDIEVRGLVLETLNNSYL
jgi:hypothetical protein